MQAMPERGERASVEPEVSRLAVWSFVCGLFCYLPPVSVLAIILATRAWRAIRRSHGRLVGRRIATTGLWISLTVMLLSLSIALRELGLYIRADSSRTPSCRSNLKQIGLAVGMYEGDHESAGGYQMPPDIRTLVQAGYLHVGPDDLGVLWCPSATVWRSAPPGGELPDPERDGDYYYARLVDSTSTPEDVPIMWDKRRHVHRRFWHWTGGVYGGVNVLRVDGSARWMPDDEFTAALARYRALYEADPPLPTNPPVPRGWSALEYALALALGFPFLIAGIAAVRGGAFARWLYARLPDRPGDVEAETARSADDTDAHVSPAKQDGV